MFNFFKKKTVFLILFVFILIVSLFYWKWKGSSITPKTNLNSLKYEKIIEEIKINKPGSLKKAEVFVNENNNIYGTLTSMFLAKKYILQNNLKQAFIQLNNSLKYTKDKNLKNILKLRMSKIKIQEKENKQALEILKSIKDKNWNNIVENMKGDIFINKNNKILAIKYWKKSLSLEISNASKEIIKMKINELK